MAIEAPNTPPEQQSMTSLVSGIVSDFQDLVKQQMKLMRQEIADDLRKSKEAAVFFTAGGLVCFVGLIGTVLMLGHLFHWLGQPSGTDASSLPLWGAFAIAAGLFLIGGGALILFGRQRLTAMGTPLHDTAQALKENLEWKTRTSPS